MLNIQDKGLKFGWSKKPNYVRASKPNQRFLCFSLDFCIEFVGFWISFSEAAVILH